MVGELRRHEIGFASLHEPIDATTPGGRLVFHVFAAVVEFIRELIFKVAVKDSTLRAPAVESVAGRVSSHPNRSGQPEIYCLTRTDP